MTRRIPIWDLPTRVFHWSLAASFIVAYLSGESERWALVHVTCGYTLLGLIVFRLIWGLAGTRHARFAEFVAGPRSVARHVADMIKGHPTRYVGHNPVGALSILALLLLGLVSALSGWMAYDDVGGEWLEELHGSASSVMLAMVFAHIAGVLMSSRQHRENLIRSMLDGRKKAEANQAIATTRPVVALFVLAGLIGFWVWSFSGYFQVDGGATPIKLEMLPAKSDHPQ
jgi:cytochrome b